MISVASAVNCHLIGTFFKNYKYLVICSSKQQNHRLSKRARIVSESLIFIHCNVICHPPMPTRNARKEIICAFNSLTGVKLMNTEVHQAYSDRSDLRYKQALMQASHMHRLTESGKSYSIAAAWEC